MSDPAASYAQTYVEQAVALAQQGRLDEAITSLHYALQWQPGRFDALRNLAAIHFRRGSSEQALGCYEELVRCHPADPIVHHGLGVMLERLGRLDEALASYQRSLDIEPVNGEAWTNVGTLRRARGDLEGAVACYQEALRSQPDYLPALNNLALVLGESGRIEEAVASYRHALRVDPSAAEVHSNLADLLARQDLLEQAAFSYQEALRLRPGLAEAYNGLGLVRGRQGLLSEASACHSQALALNPNYTDAYNNLGGALFKQGRFEEALAHYGEAIRLRPSFAEAHVNRAATFAEQGRFAESVASLQDALRIKPDYREAYQNLGVSLSRLHRFDEALACFEQSLRFNPDAADSHHSRGMLLLLRGDFERGWPEYEWRWRLPGYPARPFPAPLWDGGPLRGKTILLHAEQGFGDTIQFLRYAPLVKSRGGTVVLACQPALAPLAASCPGIDHLVTGAEAIPLFQVHAPLTSLPAILGTTLSNIPADVAYVYARPDLVEHWRPKVRADGSFHIGVGWQGNPAFPGDRFRSFALQEFAPIGQLAGVRLISLQKGYGREQLTDSANAFAVVDLGEGLDEATGAFMDTAAIMQSLDLVITSDTALAHLAGALSVRVWIALPYYPDWRWLLDRSDSPWYPTARLFRQREPGNWKPVFEQMAEELRRIV